MAKQSTLRLILASGSPARRELLTRAGYSFEVIPSKIEEPTGEGISDIRQFVQHVAWLKAADVAPQVEKGLILAADTVAWLNGQVLGKPNNIEDARRILLTLSGREHQLWTGVCLWRRPDDLQLAWQEVTRVFFRPMSGEEMNKYLASGAWQGCSGGYAIQEEGDPLIRIVEGSVSNVVGLPMETLERVLAGIVA